jgi:hypothetical protein
LSDIDEKEGWKKKYTQRMEEEVYTAEEQVSLGKVCWWRKR